MSTFDSWRVQVNFENNTGRTLPAAGVTGATVMRTSRGPLHPVRFSPGETRRILDLFGPPTPSKPDVMDLITFNQSFPVWVVAPVGEGAYHGGVHFTTDNGVVPFTGGVSSVTGVSYSSWPNFEVVGTGDGSTANFSATLEGLDNYNALSVTIFVGGQELSGVNVVAGSGDEEDITDNASGSGTLDTVTGSFDYTFGTAPAAGEKVEVHYTTDFSSTVYFSLVAASPQKDNLGVSATYDDTEDSFTLEMYREGRKGKWNELADSPFTVSLDEEAVDARDQSIYIKNIFEEGNNLVIPIVNDTLYDSSGINSGNWVDSTDIVDFEGGRRGSDPIATDIVTGYQYFHQTRKYPANLFFDTTAFPEVANEYSNLRNNFHKYDRFILPLPLGDVSQAKTDFDALGLDNRGISVYWNWGTVRNRFSSTGNVLSPLTGFIAVKHGQIMENAFGGLAPAWTNGAGNLGGVLPAGIEKLEYDPDQTQLQELFNERINAITDEPSIGILAQSERTTQVQVNDDAFISHSGTKDYVVKEILNQVVPFQLLKLNDTAHRNTVTNRATAIIAPMTVEPTNVLREFAVRCDETNNTDEVLARDEFVLTVGIKVTPMSRYFIFNVVNTAQGASVEEATL